MYLIPGEFHPSKDDPNSASCSFAHTPASLLLTSFFLGVYTRSHYSVLRCLKFSAGCINSETVARLAYRL